MLHQPIGESRDIHVEDPALKLGDDLTVKNFKAKIRLGRTPQGIVVQAVFRGSLPAECVRCLNDFDQNLKATFSDLYAFDYRSVTESGLIIPEDGNIDLTELVREYLLLDFPLKPLCKPDCKGLCMVCGEDLNMGNCEHAAQVKYEE